VATKSNCKFDQFYYKSQAQKRLKLVYDYARTDLESGDYIDVYHLCAGIAGVELRYMLNHAEFNMWHDIRAYGRFMHFYPEYSIDDDYVDFADPFKKIVIEVDSNLHDESRDVAKNDRLSMAGYRVIRVDKKYTEKDLEEIWAAIDATKSLGKHNIAKYLEDELPHNGQAIIKALRREFTPKRVSKKESTRAVYLSDYVNSTKFKKLHRKYHTNLPKRLEDAITAIPLIKIL
jgi:very-short-patch-repair endonuclease